MYYGSKSKTKPKPKEPQRSPRILGLGLFKLDFYLNLTDEQIKQYNIDFSKINGPKDLAFITEDPALLDLIQISSSDTLSNILLYLNKASIQKSFVELITLSPLRIHPDEEHMKKIFTHVTEHNYLFSNEMSVSSVPNKISFAFKNGKKLLKYFDIITDYDPYTEDILHEDSKKNLYDNLKEINEIENYNENLKKKTEDKSVRSHQNYEEDEIYNNKSKHMETSKHEEQNNKRSFDDEDNYKINEVRDEEEVIEDQNMSVRKTQSRKSHNLNNNEENIENEASNREDIDERLSEKGENMNDLNDLSQNRSKISNKTQTRKDNKSNLNEEENLENNQEQLDDEEQNYKEEVLGKSEKASNVGSKILKTNSVKNDLNENDGNDDHKKDGEEMEEDFNVEDLEEIKDENLNYSNLHNQSKKKEITQPSNRSDNDLQQERRKQSSYKFQEPYEKNQSVNKGLGGSIRNEQASQNCKNMDTNNKNQSKKYTSMNYGNNEDLKKNIRPLYEGEDLNKNEKSISGSKLINIPAACEIEEYDFLFIDLEEFINFHSNGFHLSELAEFLKKISTNDKKPRIVLNYPNILINLNVVNLELLETLMSIMSYTDIFLFEKKECLAFFNMLNQMNYEKDLNEKQLIEYFFKEVPHQKASVSKLGLFLDELQKFTVAEQKKDKIINNLSYEINLHPKINHFNQKIVDEYKKIMTINNSYFKSIFFGGYFSSYIFNEDHYTSYFTGAESTKRILEIFKNKIDFPTNTEFYLVKLQKNKIIKDQQKEKLKQKEEKFVLDCVNKTNSSIKFYNPLFDDNLNAFFASGAVRKQLKDKGFINTNGFVLYDSSYKNLHGVPPKAKKRLDTSERERHLLLAIKQNKELLSTDLESFSKSLKGQSPTNRKLPLPSFEINSSNLYISSKIKNLKTSKKKLKPINTRNSNSKFTNEKSLENNKTSSKSKSPNKKDITVSKNNNSNTNKQQNKNNSSEGLDTSIVKDREEKNNYKEHSKLSSRGDSDYEANSDHELRKSQVNKSKTQTISVGNQRYSENSRNEIDKSKSNAKGDFNNSKQNTVNNYNDNMEEEMNYENNEEENKDYLEKSKGTHYNEENIEAENLGDNYNNNEENKEEENKIEKAADEEENEERANEDEMGNYAYNEGNEAQEGQEEEEKKERNETENNLEKFESKIDNEMENMENLEENAEAGENKEEDKVQAVEEN